MPRVLALIFVWCLVAALFAVRPQTPQKPTFRTGVDVVAVDDSGQAPAGSVEELVARAGQELLRYAEQLSLVIGVERYAQYKGDESFQRAAKQMLVAEFALVRVKDDWLGFRDGVFEGQLPGDLFRLQALPNVGACDHAQVKAGGS